MTYYNPSDQQQYQQPQINNHPQYSQQQYQPPQPLRVQYSALPPQETEHNQYPKLDKVVSVKHCHHYLSLMEQFLLYKERFDSTHLKIMLARAERRYIQWREIVHTSFSKTGYQSFVPPLDIAYMWHTHMLSPFRYFEDSIRLNQMDLFKINLPLGKLHEYASTRISLAEMNSWRLYYGTEEPYYLNPENVVVGTTMVNCTYCSEKMECSWIEYADWRTNPDLNIRCHTCRQSTSVGTASVARLAKDIEGRSYLVAGTLLEKNGSLKGPGKFQLQRAMAFCVEKAEKDLPESRLVIPSRSMEDIITYIEKTCSNTRKGASNWHRIVSVFLVNALRSCYLNNPSPFSLDLIQAVGRQQAFNVKAVRTIDWQSPYGIARAIRQYNEFLKMIMAHPTQVMVPTLEIDLAWHTHMLHPATYRTFTFKYTGQYVNHDDNIVPEKLKTYADGTDKAWRAKNGHNLINGGDNGPAKKSTSKRAGFFSKVRDALSSGFGDDYIPGTLPESFAQNGVIDGAALKTSTKESYHDRRTVKSILGIKNNTYSDSVQNNIHHQLENNGYGYVGTVNCASGSTGRNLYYNHQLYAVQSIKPSSASTQRWADLTPVLQPNSVQKLSKKLKSKSKPAKHKHDNRGKPLEIAPGLGELIGNAINNCNSSSANCGGGMTRL
ncbi:hypothetical protein BDB00DRAFT_846139 [Zychaea mexicana]|uniref:uncharacterized protein n=1 Tax=Zychaea mexicana TaxID=64656 RepID=UPI0022FED4DB|nr:uncharacterized protein BDB00DRAFT_846139 [Zychaea mexicana]KAI9488896.1 hypothetical protein BDB00DRAFT_846139 [Zychaea mexicana]